MEFNGKVTHKTKKELVGKTISKTKYQSRRSNSTKNTRTQCFSRLFGKSQPLLDEVNVVRYVTVSVNVKCSEYKGRWWYTNLSGWAIKESRATS